DSAAFAITAAAAHHVVDVRVDGVSIGATDSVTLTNVQSDHALWAVFAPDTVDIAAAAGANGAITPGATIAVAAVGSSPMITAAIPYGASQTYLITADPGYHVADVIVDGVSVGPVSSYTFESVLEPHTILAEFALDTYDITPSAGPNGSITPDDVRAVPYGESVTFDMTPAAGYRVLSVLVDGSSVGNAYSYTFTNVTAPHSISVSFAPKLATSLTVRSSTSRPRRYRSFTLSGSLRPGQPAGTTVALQAWRPNRRVWTTIWVGPVNRYSNWAKSYRPTVRGTHYFRTIFYGNRDYAPVMSRRLTLRVR
ncbi:MAG: hypothetical protein Q7W16_02145, partial [Coriobacteriia bacterium]|nr:hypothetical protein [Coriobacteriia bacterium]